MATRPIFIAETNNKDDSFVTRKEIEFHWYPGMAVSQKQKSITDLHNCAESSGIEKEKILEISSKSKQHLGIALSAFNLCLSLPEYKNKVSVECCYQGSKVFELGGPFVDLCDRSSREAKKDPRLKSSGRLIYFSFLGTRCNLHPTTAFYNYLYVLALHQNKELSEELLEYNAFTDIEFNPKKSINCQAYSAALYVSLATKGLLAPGLDSPGRFYNLLKSNGKEQPEEQYQQGVLF